MKVSAGRIVGRAVLALLVVLAILIVVAVVRGEALVRKVVVDAGSAFLGVKVELDSVSIRPLRGHIGIHGLRVGNPEGFKSPNLFDLGSVHVNIIPRTIWQQKIVIEEIRVVKPEVTYEIGLGKTNVGKLLDQLEGDAEAETPEAEPAPEAKPAEAGGRQVVIRHFVVEGGEVHLATTVLGGKGATVALKNLELRNIGEEGGGVSAADVVTLVLGTVLKSIIGAVGDLGGAAVDGAKAVGGAAVDGAVAVGGAGVDAAKAVGEVGVDAAKTVGKGVAGAAKGIGHAASAGASGLLHGIGQLVPGGDDKPKADEPAATNHTEEAP